MTRKMNVTEARTLISAVVLQRNSIVLFVRECDVRNHRRRLRPIVSKRSRFFFGKR